MAKVNEIAPDVDRISVYVPEVNLQFNHFLVKLDAAPSAQAACNLLGAVLSVNDFAIRPPRVLAAEETLATGKYRFRFCSTAHLPHGWDAGVLFEETNRTLFCSDLFFHAGDVEPLTESDIVGRARSFSLCSIRSGDTPAEAKHSAIRSTVRRPSSVRGRCGFSASVLAAPCWTR